MALTCVGAVEGSAPVSGASGQLQTFGMALSVAQRPSVMAWLVTSACLVCSADVDDQRRNAYLQGMRRRFLVGAVSTGLASVILIVMSVVAGGSAPPLWIGIALALIAVLIAAIGRVLLPRVADQATGTEERYARTHRNQVVAAWVVTGVAAATLVAGLVLLFVSVLVGAVVAAFGAAYLAYRLYELRELRRQ